MVSPASLRLTFPPPGLLTSPPPLSPLPHPTPHQLNETEENDVHVSFSDQQSINAFSRYNNKISDYEEDLRLKREEKEAVEEVLMEMELVDEEEEVL
jgi:hypothetical protein